MDLGKRHVCFLHPMQVGFPESSFEGRPCCCLDKEGRVRSMCKVRNGEELVHVRVVCPVCVSAHCVIFLGEACYVQVCGLALPLWV
jgi:hypothetical protein